MAPHPHVRVPQQPHETENTRAPSLGTEQQGFSALHTRNHLFTHTRMGTFEMWNPSKVNGDWRYNQVATNLPVSHCIPPLTAASALEGLGSLLWTHLQRKVLSITSRRFSRQIHIFGNWNVCVEADEFQWAGALSRDKARCQTYPMEY